MGYKTTRSRQCQSLKFDPSGGLNLSLPAHAIQENELSSAYNVIYSPSSGVLTSRPAFRCYTATALPDGIDNIHPFQQNIMCSCKNGKLYALDVDPSSATFTEYVFITDILQTALFINFNDKLLFVDGTGLYSWDGDKTAITITTLLDSSTTPALTPSVLAEAQNRVVINDIVDADAVYFSGPEDETDWDTSGGAAVGLRAGYGDDMEVNGIAVLGQDIIVSKVGKGKRFLYRVNIAGDPSSWSVQNLIADSCAADALLICSIPNNVLYVNEDAELRGIAGIQEYGDLRMINAGEKINPGLFKLNKDGYAPTVLKYLPSYDILMVICSGRVYAFQHSTGRFTYLDGLSSEISVNCCCDYEGDPVWGGENGHIYEWVDSGLSDSPEIGTSSDYATRIRSKTFPMPGEMLLKKSHFNMVSVAEGEGRVEINNTIIKRFTIDPPGWELYDANSELYEADMELYSAEDGGVNVTIRSRVRKKDFFIEILTDSGRIGFNYFDAIFSMLNG